MFELTAAIDLGSNSFHMIVARIQNGQLIVIDRIREMVRLAEGMDQDGNIQPPAQERALACLQRFGERLQDFPEGSVRAVGTNTLRCANNSDEFLAAAEAALGHSIDIIAGVEEARLIYLGVAHSLAPSDEKRLVMDIGGGSTEFIVGQNYQPHFMESLEMGCVTATQRFFPDGEITEARVRRAYLFVQSELEPHIQTFKRLDWTQAIGASGSIRAVMKVFISSGKTNGDITRPALSELLTQLQAMGHINKIALPGLSAERAQVFLGGVVILAATFETLGIELMQVSDRALREGLIHDLFGRIQRHDVRDHSVNALASRYHADAEHARRVAATATDLLRQVAEAWKLDMETQEKWLHWAARLHEIGLDIAHSRHHHHAAYIIEHCDLAGFSRQEQQRLAAIVCSHRRKLPVKLYKQLPKRLSKPVKQLAALLRLAVILHRNRSKESLPPITLKADDKQLHLDIASQWLEQHPLTRTDLEQEVSYLQAIGLSLTLPQDQPPG